MDITNDTIQDAVRAELASDPRLPYADEIAVEAHGGAVTLRGAVGSFAQQRAAMADARRTARSRLSSAPTSSSTQSRGCSA